MSSVDTYPGAFWRLYRSEARLVLGRRRNIALLVVLAIVPLLIAVGVASSRHQDSGGPAFLGQITGNGLFLVFTALTVCTPLFLPLVVGVVAGDSIAGEAGTGTLRYLLTLPVTRGRLLVAKTLGTLTFTAVSVLVVAVSGLLAGAAFFGLHNVTLLSGDTVSLGNGIGRAGLIALYLVVALFGLAAIGLFVSTITENAIAAMATTVGLAVFSLVLDSVPQLSAIHGVLLTHNWLGFGELLRTQVDSAALLRWSALHLAYAAVFLSLAYARLTTKDVTS
ncbi:MAG: transporter permease [Frankiales bacterium]|nr:transporter permease [Frankiales bacterium]MCW2707507.1 transporter permease [Frankiales bacterium]